MVNRLLELLDDKAHCRELTRPIAHRRTTGHIQNIPERQCLEASKGSTHAQIKLLAHSHCVCQMLIGHGKVLTSFLDVFGGQSGEVGSKDLDVGIDLLTNLHHIIGYTLTLSVTVKPQDQELASLGVVPQVLRH